MRRLTAVMVVVLSTGALAQTRAARCWAACERNVDDAQQRATVCKACLTNPGELAGWLEQVKAPRDRLLGDPEWEVRWAGLRAEARRTGRTAALELGAWLKREPDARERACATALHAAGGTKTALAELFAKAPGVREACAAPELLALEVYSEQPTVRRDALEHLAVALGRPPARVVLDLLPSRPAAFDALVLDTLRTVQSETSQTAPAALLAAATPRDVDAMNRLLVVFARHHDAAKAQLANATDRVERKAALVELGALAPLSEVELLVAVTDAEASLRATAVRALARGETGSIPDVVALRLTGVRPATRAQQLALVRLMGDTHETGCVSVGLSAWGERALAPEVRGEALAAAASCEWDAASAEVLRALQSADVDERVAAVAALAFAPPSEPLFEQLRAAAASPEAALKIAACRTMAARRWRGGITSVTALVADPDPRTRIAALEALLALDAEGVEGKIAQRALVDPAPEVRKVALSLLGRLGTPRAIGALAEAARKDPDADVKLVAEQTLRKLRSP